jgi:hypothetical protein
MQTGLYSVEFSSGTGSFGAGIIVLPAIRFTAGTQATITQGQLKLAKELRRREFGSVIITASVTLFSGL